jgi:hypothetical protein
MFGFPDPLLTCMANIGPVVEGAIIGKECVDVRELINTLDPLLIHP